MRELRNVIERLMIMVPGDTIAMRDLAFLTATASRRRAGRDRRRRAAAARGARPLRAHYILRVLAAQQGNMSRTAEVLGVERSNLYRKMRAFGHRPGRGRG